jgi:spore maturation protein CgeB
VGNVSAGRRIGGSAYRRVGVWRSTISPGLEIGGDDERTSELYEFLIKPVRDLRLKAIVYGVRFPAFSLKTLAEAGINYGGWLPNFRVPKVFGRAKVTVHIPRRPYASALPGIPPIRPFEALACGVPLVSAPRRDAEKLFRAGEDLLFAENGAQMTRHLNAATIPRTPAAD